MVQRIWSVVADVANDVNSPVSSEFGGTNRKGVGGGGISNYTSTRDGTQQLISSSFNSCLHAHHENHSWGGIYFFPPGPCRSVLSALPSTSTLSRRSRMLRSPPRCVGCVCERIAICPFDPVTEFRPVCRLCVQTDRLSSFLRYHRI